jgi:hypothetical protein
VSILRFHPPTFLAAVALAAACSGGSPAPTGPTVGSPNAILAGAGDIGFCGPPGQSGTEATARLLDRIDGSVFTAGDAAYPRGAMADFLQCYDPSWGRHLGRTRPSPGNHEYESGGLDYFSYFGASAGPGGSGYYAYTAGTWRVIALDSEIPVTEGSPQVAWLRSELAANPAPCTAAYWHRPLFSSGRHGDNPDMRAVWRVLYDAGVDVVINGHDHIYERFAPQGAEGQLDPARGIREFVVGTGGAPLYEFPTVRPNSEVRGVSWGIIVLTLAPGSYSWQFVPVDGQTFRDSGSATCH